MGIEKVLEIGPLMRGVQRVEQRLHEVSGGPEKRILLGQYVTLQGRLAEVVAR